MNHFLRYMPQANNTQISKWTSETANEAISFCTIHDWNTSQ